ncbi:MULTISPECIES: PLP-dependent aminotransferase family protein [Kitasatospora]|uniref:Putative aminotransferase n=1 Tax=Kitasatospora setae (strain ATCC 33774 / DSM 43861 / JCM 3304 / KCC A-0304 / NBRC 14216 / KM-6054) TaxID=452652 RepID=E4MZT4_KITSK|nr:MULTISPECIES: PLP-dependent aminotransferase family protein [Kitasatospora]BAJ30018.1 putative aminotransferase [Kitasatospora setae KM-6054]
MWTDTRPPAEMPKLFERGADVISLAGGLPDLDVLPLDEISAQLGRLVRLGGRLALQYTTPHVAKALVPAVADLMAREGGLADADNLIPTSGSQMGLTAVALALGSPGDTILTQTPAYPGATAAFRTAGLLPYAAAEDAEGLDPVELRRTVQELRSAGHTVRLLYTNPTFQNPTGATLAVPRRAAILAACRELDLLLVEDNPYGLLGFDGTTTTLFQALDPERVVYLGTFSKIFAPGLRSGWIAAPAHLRHDLARVAEIISLSPSALAQGALAAYHSRSGWDTLIDRYRDSYRERCALMADALDAELGTGTPWHWQRPGGGFYLWLRHRDRADAGPYARAAADRGVSVVPGGHFSIDGEHADGLRLCFSNVPRRKIAEAVGRLSAALTETPSEQREFAEVAG